MTKNEKVLKRAFQLLVMDFINDGPKTYCRAVCKQDYCSPDKEKDCTEKMFAYYERKAKEAICKGN